MLIIIYGGAKEKYIYIYSHLKNLLYIFFYFFWFFGFDFSDCTGIYRSYRTSRFLGNRNP